MTQYAIIRDEYLDARNAFVSDQISPEEFNIILIKWEDAWQEKHGRNVETRFLGDSEIKLRMKMYQQIIMNADKSIEALRTKCEHNKTGVEEQTENIYCKICQKTLN